MTVLCSQSLMADVLLLSNEQITNFCGSGVFPSSEAGKLCFASTVQRYLIYLQAKLNQGGQPVELCPVDLDGATESLIRQQLESISALSAEDFSIELPDDTELGEWLDV